MAPDPEEELTEKKPRPLDEDEISLLKTYGLGPYSTTIKRSEKEIKEMEKNVNDLCDDIKGWWLWGYWIYPLMYAQNGIAVNDFLETKWKKVSKLQTV